ncbi:MAG: hypothetical protein J7L54_05065 [Elusimicrobia bacterium]|nr:hypothetical protein [Elusimicrobiota bacterium]
MKNIASNSCQQGCVSEKFDPVFAANTERAIPLARASLTARLRVMKKIKNESPTCTQVGDVAGDVSRQKKLKR